MNRIEPVHAMERETLWIRIRRRPLAQQIGLAAAALAVVLLAAWFLYPRPTAQTAPPPPTPVGIIVVSEQPVTLTTELPGRTSAFETSDVRPQVDGIIRARLFTEGDYVRAGLGSIVKLSDHYALLFSGGPTCADHRTGYHFYGALGLNF